jgi:hypothetical protein
MNLYNAMVIEGATTFPMAEIVGIGNRTMSERLAAYQDAGRRIDEKFIEFSDLLPLRLDQAVQVYMAQNPLKDWKLLQSEKTYDEFGRCRIDLLAEDEVGQAVLDYKVKVKLDPEWESKSVNDHANGNQRFHYQHATGAKRFGIILVVLGGNRKKVKPYTKVFLFGDSPYYDSGLWFNDAREHWQRMSVYKHAREQFGDRVFIPGSVVHEDKFGPCEYEDACMVHNLDPQAMAVQYVKIERSK